MSDTILEAIDNLTTAVQRLSRCCEYGGGGTEPPQPPITEGDPPPEGWQPPVDPDTGDETDPGTPAYQSRKCKVANYIYDELHEFLTLLDTYDIPNITEKLGIGMVVSIMLVLLSGLAGPLGILVAIIGVVSGSLAAYLASSVDLDTLLTILKNNQTDIVCALYNSGNTEQGRADIDQILDDAGANFAQRTFVSNILDNAVLNWLFAKFTGIDKDDRGEAIERAIDGYEGSVDCGGCSCENRTLNSYGKILSDDGSAIEIESRNRDSWHRVHIFFNNAGTVNAFCGPTMTITNITILSGTVDRGENPDPKEWRVRNQETGPEGKLYEERYPPPLPFSAATIFIGSNEAFVVRIEYRQEEQD